MPDFAALANSIWNFPVQAGTFGIVVIAASGFLGRFVANRAVDKRKAEFEEQLTRTKADLDRESARAKGGLDTELERVRAALLRETEAHRLRLKKNELLFDRQLEAARAFLQLHRTIYPNWSHRMEEWPDAVEKVTDRLGQTEKDLRDFLAEHGVVMISDARVALQKCIDTAGSHKFDGADGYPSDYLEEFLRDLKTVENLLLHRINE